MRIAQVASLASPVRRVGSDSIESIVWLLAHELTERGHDVTTFACEGSDVDGELVATLPGPYARNGSPGDWRLCEWINLTRAVAESGGFDLIHSHNYLYGIPLEDACACPMLHTHHVSPYADAAFIWRKCPAARVTAISKFQWSGFPDLRPVAIVPHGLDEAQFTFRARPDDYLLYLGRFIENKGPLAAIRIARAVGMRLVLAGPRNDYFTSEIEPHVDGRAVQYVGAVHGAARDQLLGGARVLLYPVQVPEPFGLVLAEAALCGTPSAAIGIGAVPEVVQDAVSGCFAASEAEMPAAVLRAAALDRTAVRASASRRFSASRMATQYLDVYESLLTAGSAVAASRGRP